MHKLTYTHTHSHIHIFNNKEAYFKAVYLHCDKRRQAFEDTKDM